MNLVSGFPNQCVPIEELRKLRDKEKKLRQRIEDKKNKKQKTTESSSNQDVVQEEVARASLSPSPTEMTSGPLRSFFYMNPPNFDPLDFTEEGFDAES